MPTSLVNVRVLSGWVLGVAAWVVVGPAIAKTPSLAAAISTDVIPSWSETPRSVVPVSFEPYPEPMAQDGDPALVDAAAGEPCAACGGGYGGYPYNRCGCNAQLFPWLRGPGNCDQWCVGPHWEVAADGLVLFRENADWASVAAAVGVAPDLVEQFDQAPGARLFVTGYNDAGFGLQVGYEGVNDFHATSLFPLAGASRSFTAESRVNSVEINVVRRSNARWRPFGGVRFIQLDDDFIDFTTVDKPVPPPATPPAGPAAFIDTGSAQLITNRLIGFQAGAFRDMWRVGRRLTIEPYGNAGVYLNDFRRDNIDRTRTTIITGDDLGTAANEFSQTTSEVSTATRQEISEMAFVGEAGVTSVLRVTQCVALRGGYQVLAINGVGQGLDAFFAPGLDATTLVYHGFYFGLDYVR
jgi:hypothetical protein